MIVVEFLVAIGIFLALVAGIILFLREMRDKNKEIK